MDIYSNFKACEGQPIPNNVCALFMQYYEAKSYIIR